MDSGRNVANLPDESLDPMTSVAKTGIYYGYARVHFGEAEDVPREDREVWPMVMSMGWNPYYKNEKLTAVSACVPPNKLYGLLVGAIV